MSFSLSVLNKITKIRIDDKVYYHFPEATVIAWTTDDEVQVSGYPYPNAKRVPFSEISPNFSATDAESYCDALTSNPGVLRTEILGGGASGTQDVNIVSPNPLPTQEQNPLTNIAVNNLPSNQNVTVTNTPNVNVQNFPATQNVNISSQTGADPLNVTGNLTINEPTYTRPFVFSSGTDKLDAQDEDEIYVVAVIQLIDKTPTNSRALIFDLLTLLGVNNDDWYFTILVNPTITNDNLLPAYVSYPTAGVEVSVNIGGNDDDVVIDQGSLNVDSTLFGHQGRRQTSYQVKKDDVEEITLSGTDQIVLAVQGRTDNLDFSHSATFKTRIS